MGKVRVYELSKQLNTTSKRLMEKLKEINIEVKNHMSLLTDKELDALYDHIGVIKHDENNEEEVNKVKSKTKVINADPSKEEKKEIPRIIRKTNINLDQEKDQKELIDNKKTGFNNWKNKDSRKKNIVRKTDENSGLRMGFARDTGREIIKNVKAEKKIIKKSQKQIQKKCKKRF